MPVVIQMRKASEHHSFRTTSGLVLIEDEKLHSHLVEYPSILPAV